MELELPAHFFVIHIGKPNDEVPPDIDVSAFPHSQIVSRIHADIIRDEDEFYIEDTRSANGLYINHTPLPKGNHIVSNQAIELLWVKKIKLVLSFN